MIATPQRRYLSSSRVSELARLAHDLAAEFARTARDCDNGQMARLSLAVGQIVDLLADRAEDIYAEEVDAR